MSESKLPPDKHTVMVAYLAVMGMLGVSPNLGYVKTNMREMTMSGIIIRG